MSNDNKIIMQDYKKLTILLNTIISDFTVKGDFTESEKVEYKNLKSELTLVKSIDEMSLLKEKILFLFTSVCKNVDKWRAITLHEKLLKKGYFNDYKELNKSLANLGILELSELQKKLKSDSNLFEEIAEDSWLLYLENISEIPSDLDCLIKRKFTSNILKDKERWKKKFNINEIAKLISIEDISDFYSDEELAKELKSANLSLTISLKETLSDERKESIVWKMPSICGYKKYTINSEWSYINPLSIWLSEEDRISYFLEKTPHWQLDDKLLNPDGGIMSYTGTSSEILSLDQIDELMKKFESSNLIDCFYKKAFKLYKSQRKKLLRNKR